MAKEVSIRRGDFVCYEETIENWWGNPIGVKKMAGTVAASRVTPIRGGGARPMSGAQW